MSTLTADDSEDNPKLSKIIQALHTQGRLSRSATTGFKGGRVTDILLPFPRNGQGLPVALSDQERRRFIECQQSILSKDQDFRNAIARRGAEHFHFPEDWALQTFSQVSNEGDRKLDFDDEAALLGRGGFGRVAAVRMRRHPSEPIRALKRVTRPNSDTWSAIDRIGDGERERFPDGRQEHFEQERKALLHIREKTPRDEWASLRDIKQNHLIEIVTTFTDPQAFYLLMSPVASCNLEDVMHSEHEVHRATLLRRLPQFFGCIAATVFFLHRHNIRHGDLKPKNILIVLDKMPSSPKICICDFATARYAVNGSSVEARGSRRVEDEAYTTPERCKKEPQDLPDDMYTLGLVFLEMITVIKGKSKKDLCEYIENVGGNGTLPILTNRCLPETLHSWLDGLLCSGELESDAAIDLVKKLIRESPEARLDSVGVVRAIRDARGANLDWGPCCQPWYEQTMLSDAGTNDTNVFANILDYTLGEIGNNNRSDEQSRPQCPHRNVDSKSLTITREKSLEWRIVVGIDADWPIIERKINFWIPATGFRLKAHSGSSISIKWPHFNNLCEERDGDYGLYFWRGTDPQKTNRRLRVTFSSSSDVQKLKNLLTFTGVQGPNREDKEIRMSNTHSFLFRFIQLGEDILKIREPSRYGSRTRAFFNVKESNSGWTDYMLYLVPQGLSGIDMEHPNPRVVLLGLESVNFHGSRRQHDRPPNEAEHVSHRSFADREFEIDLPTHPPTSSITTNSGSSTGSEVSRQPFLEFIAQLADPWAPHSFYLLQQVTCLNGRFSFDEKLGQAMMILWQHLPGSYWISLRFKAPRQRFRRWLHGKVSRLEKYEPGRKRCDIHLENLFYIDTLEMKKFEGPGNGERRLIRLHSFGEQEFLPVVQAIEGSRSKMYGY